MQGKRLPPSRGAGLRPSWKPQTSANIAAWHSGNAGAGEAPALPGAPCRERGHLARNGRPARSFPIPPVSHDNHSSYGTIHFSKEVAGELLRQICRLLKSETAKYHHRTRWECGAGSAAVPAARASRPLLPDPVILLKTMAFLVARGLSEKWKVSPKPGKMPVADETSALPDRLGC
jgi:hypothetical protein